MKIEKKPTKKVFIIAISVACLVVIAGLGFYFLTKKTNNTTTNKQSGDATSTTTTQPSGGGITSTKDDGSASTPAPTPDAGVTPVKPSGTFVSNHRPNLSGTPAPNTITSTCTTTPGSQCTIRFTNGSTSLSLPSKTTDGNGNVNWTWKLQDMGLTAGTWKITAIATNGSHSAEESDALDLIIEE